MKILVTGGLGYIGSTLVKYLVENTNHEIVIVDKNMFDLKPSFLLFINNSERIKYHCFDACNLDMLYWLVKECDYVIHLAGLRLSYCEEHKSEAYQINEFLTCVIGMMVHRFEKKMIFASTCSNYGIAGIMAKEQYSLYPNSCYAKSKVNAENYLLKNIPECIILRFATAYGVGESFTRWDTLVNSFVKDSLDNSLIKIFQPGTFRPIFHVKDIVRAIHAVIGKKKVYDRVFNVGSTEQNYKKIEITRKISEICKCKIIIAAKGDSRDYKVDFSRFAKEFEFVPQYNLDQGILELSQACKK